ncbi:MAG: hypothetical protein ACI4OH_05305, partial [Mitsuokella sp.]|uniref:hypothetical protein n=1 Tax=Mitsuokella sp. TaxID=2049034 RepID=UPI003F026901
RKEIRREKSRSVSAPFHKCTSAQNLARRNTCEVFLYQKRDIIAMTRRAEGRQRFAGQFAKNIFCPLWHPEKNKNALRLNDCSFSGILVGKKYFLYANCQCSAFVSPLPSSLCTVRSIS